MATALFDDSVKMTKFEIIEKLKICGIATRPFFGPLSSLKAYENYSDSARAKISNKNAYDISRRGINLPRAACINTGSIGQIRDIIKKLNKHEK